jgi:hypothetical protein
MRRILLTLIALLTLAATAQAEPPKVEPPKVDDPRFMFDPKDMVQIKSGITKFDIDGDGLEDFVVKSLRNNITADQPSIYTFYRTCKYDDKKDTCLSNKIETIFFKHNINEHDLYESFWTYIKVTGVLHDIRVIKEKTNNRHIIISASRDFKERSAEANNVIFTIYRLYVPQDSENSHRYIPPAFWKEDGVYISKGVYVDVGEAFLLELGLPNPEADRYYYFEKTGGKPPIDQTSNPKED